MMRVFIRGKSYSFPLFYGVFEDERQQNGWRAMKFGL